MSPDDNVTLTPIWDSETITMVCDVYPDMASRAEVLRRLRDMLLFEVEQLERALEVSPRTSEIRGWWKNSRRAGDKNE